MGLGYVETEWDLINQNADQYLDTVNAIYKVQELQNKYLDAIEKSSSPTQQKKLNDLMQQETDYLREQDKLSEYDLERANLKYEIALKQMALEEIVSGINVNERQMDHRIVLPIRLGYELEVIPEILSFRASAGPALSWTLASSTELSMFGALNMEFIYNNIDGDLEFSHFPYDTSLQPVITESIQNASYLHKRLDLSVGGSIEALIIKNIGLEIGYDFGLLNRFRKSEDATYRRNGLSVTFNYIF